jgi:serine/threonine protein kinase
MNRDPLIGKQLANFLIEKAIGRGGMAQIYYGVDITLDRPVAIKVIDVRFQGDPEYARRFVDEAKMVARWKHENIVSVYYADQEDDVYYFAMEFIDGAGLDELLESYLERGELMPHEDVLRIGKDMAKALDYAHSKGVVHRDFKPSNVMISRDDRVILADFGLALDINMGSMGQIFGTPHYIAPEQARHSSDAVPQSDIYALGVVLYEMLTGVVPFDDESAMAVAVQHMSEAPPLPTDLNPILSKELEAVLLKALEKEPENRYQSGAELMQALDDAIKQMKYQAREIPAILPPIAVSGKPVAKKLSALSISDMLRAELEKEEEVTQQSFRAPRVPNLHQEETQQMRAPQITQPAKQNRTTEVQEMPTQKTVIGKQVQQQKSAPAHSGMKIIIGVGAVAIIGLIIAVLLLMRQGSETDTGFEPSPTIVDEGIVHEAASNTAIPATEIMTATHPPVIQATATELVPPTEDIGPAQTQTSQAAMDLLATQNMLTQNALLQSTEIAQTQATQLVLEPTIVFPNGRPIEMTYNSSGFYLRNNDSDSNIRMSRLAFRAMTADGFETGNGFDGVNWARFYNFIDRNGHCVAIELTDQAAWIRPTNCAAAAGNAFNSLLTFTPQDQQIFWDGRNGAIQFAIFWDGAEFARCQIAEGFCQLRVGD